MALRSSIQEQKGGCHFGRRNDSHSTEGQVVLRRCLYPTRDPKKGSTELTDMMVVGAMRATIVYLLCEKIGLGEHDRKKATLIEVS